MSENENMKELNEVEVEGVTGGKKHVTKKEKAEEKVHRGQSQDNTGLVSNPLPFPQDRRGNQP